LVAAVGFDPLLEEQQRPEPLPDLVQGSLSLFTFRSTQIKQPSHTVRPEKPEPLSPELERKSMSFEVISWQ
jgi:hypothetical protein